MKNDTPPQNSCSRTQISLLKILKDKKQIETNMKLIHCPNAEEVVKLIYLSTYVSNPTPKAYGPVTPVCNYINSLFTGRQKHIIMNSSTRLTLL